jgi:hypothetical protein
VKQCFHFIRDLAILPLSAWLSHDLFVRNLSTKRKDYLGVESCKMGRVGANGTSKV